ncbi:alpha/beta fold hydrolase [Marinitenerispora sediminis]|uniref:Alpha/beta hydrolase n=1 Tax=Marinitenerispora sediminis TaxID=1931232 RepID=A0A368T9D9_9ACTN|nr:alpha/beta fold hydrolase [Marinitenerispora sediminis]RCV51106.1 alpha/beta hydrolase [Marinitenerispora sediminis]RCV54616.1 alpha/beta hydrolase [Marinitenerispora sediminis]RCV61156.1 alpha/beta hydrolase [Marinitenerispora sediminis]
MNALPQPSPAARLGRVVRGSGPGLLLAHGATGGIDANYGPILDGLAASRTVVGPDYPGSGRTPLGQGELGLDALADALVRTAVEEGVPRFAIAGYSLGGPVAIRAAVRHPERVTGLVLTASFAHPSARMRLALAQWHRLLLAPDRAEAARWSLLTGFGAPLLDRMGSAELDAAAESGAASVPPGAVAQVELVQRVDVRADLARITVPTLVISTTLDHLVTPHHHRQLADGIAGAEFAELHTGHVPFLEAPQEWLALIRGFLDRHRPDRRGGA